MTDTPEALPPLPEDSRERENFDSTTTELYGGDALAQVQRTLTIFSRQAPPSGSYAKMLAIFANEVGKARAALAQRQQVPERWQLVPVEPTEDMLFAAELSKPRGYRDLHRAMLAAAPALTAAPSAQAEPSQRQGCATTSESAEPKAKAEHTAEDRADNPERARRSASLGGAALAQAESQVPLPEFECASQYATKRGLAVSREWVRGWDACTDYIEELLRAHGIGKQEGK